MALTPSDTLHRISFVINSFADPGAMVLQLSKVADLYEEVETFNNLLLAIQAAAMEDGVVDPETVIGVVKLAQLIGDDADQIRCLREIFSHKLSLPSRTAFELLKVLTNDPTCLMQVKNLLDLGFADTSKVISLLAAKPAVDQDILYFKKIVSKCKDPDRAIKNIALIATLLDSEFFVHFAYGVDFIEDLDDYLEQLRKAIQHDPKLGWRDVFTHGQMLSKEWLVRELSKLTENLGTVFVEGGWIGSLSYMIAQKIPFEKIRSFDINPQCARAADLINYANLIDGWKFKASTRDMFDSIYTGQIYHAFNYDGKQFDLSDNPDTIINTSSEHVDFEKWIDSVPAGTLVVVQNNDYLEGEGHINCQPDLETFVEKLNLSEVLYQGTLLLEKYTRFMVIGYK